MTTSHPTPAAEEYAERETGTDPYAPVPVDVRITHPVHVAETMPAAGVVSEQTPVNEFAPVCVVPERVARESVLVRAVGGDCFVGNRTVTPGTGFLLTAGAQPVRLTLSGEVWAVTATGVVSTVHALTQLRQAML